MMPKLSDLIDEELAWDELQKNLNEGLWDDAKQGLSRLIGAIKQRLGNVSGALKRAQGLISGLGGQMPGQVGEVIGALKQAMKETGEQITLDANLKAAKQLSGLDIAGTLANDLSGPVHDKAVQLQSESRLRREIDTVLTEIDAQLGSSPYGELIRIDEDISTLGMRLAHRTAGTHPMHANAIERNLRKRIDELSVRRSTLLHEEELLGEAGVLSIAGLGLAGIAGLGMLFKGAAKLATMLGAQKTADALGRAHHVVHVLEEKIIDWIVPDALSYVVYKFLWKRGIKASAEFLEKEQYIAGAGDARKKTEMVLYSAVLIFLAWNGIKAAADVGFSLLGVTEGAASAIKASEVGVAANALRTMADVAAGV